MNTNYLRELAEDLHSSTGYNPVAAALSRAADEIERIRSNAAALEDEKIAYLDYGIQRILSERDRLRAELAETQTVKDSFTVPYDYALLLDENAAMREEIGELRAELAEARKPDCRLCMNIMGCQVTAPDAITCRDGSEYFAAAPLRLYEKEGKV